MLGDIHKLCHHFFWDVLTHSPSEKTPNYKYSDSFPSLLSSFKTDLYYKIHATSLTSSSFPLPPPMMTNAPLDCNWGYVNTKPLLKQQLKQKVMEAFCGGRLGDVCCTLPLNCPSSQISLISPAHFPNPRIMMAKVRICAPCFFRVLRVVVCLGRQMSRFWIRIDLDHSTVIVGSYSSCFFKESTFFIVYRQTKKIWELD